MLLRTSPGLSPIQEAVDPSRYPARPWQVRVTHVTRRAGECDASSAPLPLMTRKDEQDEIESKGKS